MRVDTSALRSETGDLLGYVSVYHLAQDDETADDRTARRARLVRRLTDVVADINAELGAARRARPDRGQPRPS